MDTVNSYFDDLSRIIRQQLFKSDPTLTSSTCTAAAVDVVDHDFIFLFRVDAKNLYRDTHMAIAAYAVVHESFAVKVHLGYVIDTGRFIRSLSQTLSSGKHLIPDPTAEPAAR